MNLKQFLLSLTLALLCSFAATAQTTPEPSPPAQEQEQKLIEQKKEIERKALVLLDEMVAGIPSMRLPENRALMQSSVADLLWPSDEKRARALFREALANLNEITSKIDSNQPRASSIEDGAQRQRREILQLIARHDSRMALEVMRATRPAGMPLEQNPNDRRFRSEIELEQSLALQVAASDPKLALQMAKDGLAKGLSTELLNVLKRLQTIDSEAASQLAEEIIARLRGDKFETRGVSEFVAITLLQMTQPQRGDAELLMAGQLPSPESPLKISEQSLRDLIDLVTTAALESMGTNASSYMLNLIPSIMPVIEKAAPERSALLQRRMAEVGNGTEGTFIVYSRFNMLARNATIETLLDAAAKESNGEMRQMLYEQAVWKAIMQDDETRARQILGEKIPDSPRRKMMLEQIERQSVWRVVMQGKVDETRQRLARLKSKDERALAFSYLALTLALKGEKKTALQILDEARQIVTLKPRNETQLNALLQIVRAYAIAEPARAFELIETLIDQTNELIAAAATLDGFVGSGRTFRKGELILPLGYSFTIGRYHDYGKQLSQLAFINFERTKAAADRFQRQEMRLLARLLIAQAVFSERLGSGVLTGQQMGLMNY